MDLNYKLIGVRIRAIRQKKGYTQELVAERANVSTPHYSKIESGGTKLSLPCLVRVCNALEVTPDEILLDSVEKNEPRLLKEAEAFFSKCTPDEIFLVLSLGEALKKAFRLKNIELSQKN